MIQKKKFLKFLSFFLLLSCVLIKTPFDIINTLSLWAFEYETDISIFSLSIVFSSAYAIFANPLTFDSDMHLSAVDMVRSKGYQLIEYNYTTPDKYILTTWRVSNPNSKEKLRPCPVVLHHGLLDTSFTYVSNQPFQSLAYILADNGYDVWILNSRGNKFSNTHLNMTVDNEEYWDFSIDEMVKYDFQASVDFVKKTTKKEKIWYVGHSQGATQAMGYVMEGGNVDGLKGFIGLGPALFVGNHHSNLAHVISTLRFPDFFYTLGFKSLLFSRENCPFCGYMCGLIPQACSIFIHQICGVTQVDNLNHTRLSALGSHATGGTSIKNILHWMQLLRTGEFRKFDYGTELNLKKYGTPESPKYDLSKLKDFNVKKYLFRGTKDAMISKEDFEKLMEVLPKESTETFEIEDFSHLDYLWGMDANSKIYQTLLQIFEREGDE